MLNDANYPGWRAYLNGNAVPILKANFLFRGVIVPAGSNVVEFSYEPISYRLGSLITAGTLVLIVIATALVRRRRQRTSATLLEPVPDRG